MNGASTKAIKLYLTCMGLYWLVFGLITTFYPKLMDTFQTEAGIESRSAFSNNVWMHGGLDIISVCILLFTLSRDAVNRRILIAVALVALMPAVAIIYSFIATPYWNGLFIGAGLGCLAFVIWGFVLAGRMKRAERTAS